MHFKYQKTVALLIGILLLVSMSPLTLVANCEKTSTFQAQYEINNQKLYVSVPPSLYEYYGNMSHTVNTDSDYASFITPQAVEPIAESIQNITGNLPHSDEQFADAVLTLVHQIPYVINGAEYPAETLVVNSGDCVGLSILAASIMQAGGLDVVLIDYTAINPSHMNVGVYLPYTPVYHTAGLAPTDFVYDNKTYWTAEATPAEDWKVGDQSPSVANAIPVIIPLNGTQQSSPAQVSSSLNTPLLPSSITVNLSQDPLIPNVSIEPSSLLLIENTGGILISGSISPAYTGQNVSAYVFGTSSYDYFNTVTNDTGGYMLTWNFTSAGTYYITTSWSGDSNYTSADSETLTVFVGPDSFVQFETADYSYIFGQESLAPYELQPMEGINDFLNISLGTAASFSYDFTVIQAGQTVSNVQSQTVTIPASEQTISGGRNRPSVIVSVPAETVTTPINVPPDLEPLILPDDFNQTINNQFCFILQNNGGNFSLNASALNYEEMSKLMQTVGSGKTFMNASQNVLENNWYHVTESISNRAITTNLYNENGTLKESWTTPADAITNNETVMLITNNVDNAVIFKNLTVDLNSVPQPSKSSGEINNAGESLLPYVVLSILLVATISAAFVYVKKKKKNCNNMQLTNRI